jgi:hypothetical protein
MEYFGAWVVYESIIKRSNRPCVSMLWAFVSQIIVETLGTRYANTGHLIGIDFLAEIVKHI